MDWRGFVEDLIDFKGVEMDWRLKLVRRTHLMRGIRQSANPHAFIVFPAQTGKSEWYIHVGVLEDKVSPNSLVGYADADGPKPGSVDGSELPFALDQIESSGMFTIFRYMLGLMESGRARIDMAGYPFDINSLSTFAILSNPLGDPKSNFAVLLDKMSKNSSLGRRFGIILYDKEAVRIKKREKDMEELRKKAQLFRAVEEYALPEIKRIFSEEKVWAWLNERNEVFVKQALKLIEPLDKPDSEPLYLFLREFIENGGAHTRGGALRASLATNLDKIALKEYSLEDVLREAEDYLHDLLKINYESIERIVESAKELEEEAKLRAFDMLPIYMKEIVSAVELWRRNLSEADRGSLKVPMSFYLNTINYRPKSTEYFSQVLLVAKRANPEKYNESLKEHFKFDIKKETNGLMVWVHSLAPIPDLPVLGNLDILDNLANFGGKEGKEGKEGDKGGSSNNVIATKDEKESPSLVERRNGEIGETAKKPEPGQEEGEEPSPSSFAKMSKLAKMSNEAPPAEGKEKNPFAYLRRMPPSKPDEPKEADVSRVCGDCVHFGTQRCVRENPMLVSPGALYAWDCKAFQPRRRGG
jgi:hypothetical protein